MTEIHPTTMAIIAGLRGQRHERDHLASTVQRLVRETGLIDGDDIARSGLEGWDLGYRQQGQRFELTARSRDDPQYERLITAIIDRRSSATWCVISGGPLKSPSAMHDRNSSAAVCLRI